jgi:ribosomal protein S1
MWDEFFSHHKVERHRAGQGRPRDQLRALRGAARGIEGLVHVSELDEKRIEKPEEAVKVGDVYAMKIIKINEGEKKIGLSIKAGQAGRVQAGPRELPRERERRRDVHRHRLGDAFRAAQAAREREKE